MRVDSIKKRTSALYGVEAKLDLLLKQAGIEYDPGKNLPAQVREALERGEKIQAIRRYREVTGIGLREAAELIEEIQRSAGRGA
jgi:ribosomal protein L7/L12